MKITQPYAASSWESTNQLFRKLFQAVNNRLDADNITSLKDLAVLESDITPGSLLARVADNEKITGKWEHTADLTLSGLLASADLDIGAFTLRASGLIADDATKGLDLADTGTAFFLKLLSDSTTAQTANRTLTLDMDDGDRSLKMQGDLTVEALSKINQDLTDDADVLFNSLSLGVAGGNIFNLSENVIQTNIRHSNTAVASTLNYISWGKKLNTDAALRTAFEIKTRFSVIADSTRQTEVNFNIQAGGAFKTVMGFIGSNVWLPGDNRKFLLGAGNDAYFLYDGTNLIINPKYVGTGFLSILGDMSLLDRNIILGTTTGTQIGTLGGASGQKLGFWAATPIVQPLLATGAGKTVDDVITVLQNLGLVRQT